MRDKYVAPYVGAWIETLKEVEPKYYWQVAPYVGAWIETLIQLRASAGILSHPTWVRGLKPYLYRVYHHASGRTLRGCVD